MTPTQSDQPLPCRGCGYDLSGAPAQDEMVRCPECSAITPRWLLSSGLPVRRIRVVWMRAIGPVLLGGAVILAAETTYFALEADPTYRADAYSFLVMMASVLILFAATIAPIWAATTSRRDVAPMLWVILGGWCVNAVLLGIGAWVWFLLSFYVGGFR